MDIIGLINWSSERRRRVKISIRLTASEDGSPDAHHFTLAACSLFPLFLRFSICEARISKAVNVRFFPRQAIRSEEACLGSVAISFPQSPQVGLSRAADHPTAAHHLSDDASLHVLFSKAFSFRGADGNFLHRIAGGEMSPDISGGFDFKFFFICYRINNLISIICSALGLIFILCRFISMCTKCH
jgi:hypothetical protein